MEQRCILNERKRTGCASCPNHCPHYVALSGLSGNGGRVGAANVPRDYAGLTLNTSPVRESQEDIYAFLEGYVKTFERQFDEDGG